MLNHKEGYRMKALDSVALALLIVGGLNWLLVGLFEFDLVATLFGDKMHFYLRSFISSLVYVQSIALNSLDCFQETTTDISP